jgi:hypothetical protein
MAVLFLHAVYHPRLAYTTCGVVKLPPQRVSSSGCILNPSRSPRQHPSHFRLLLPVMAAHLVFSAIFREWRLLPVPFSLLILVK